MNNYSLTFVVKKNNLPKISAKWRDAIAIDSQETAQNIADDAKAQAPVAPSEFPYSGFLRDSIKAGGLTTASGAAKNRLQAQVTVGATYGHFVEFGCIYEANTQITLEDGSAKRISGIETNDRVRAQDGRGHDVIGTSRVSILDKSNLITITYPWGSKGDSQRELTVTEDHKILVFREGRNKWVEAKDLTLEDSVFTHRRVPVNKGQSLRATKICLNCLKEFKTYQHAGKAYGQGKKYCSPDCRDEHWAKGNNPHIGRKRFIETRQKQSQVAKERLENNPKSHVNFRVGNGKGQTDCEKILGKWLEEQNIEYLPNHYMGGKWVDFYIPSEGLIMEADGARWHQDQSKDITRDKYLLEKYPELDIIHLHFYDPRFTPNPLISNPLPGVQYVACNPGPDSFVDTRAFDTHKIINIEKWNHFERGGKSNKMLYDFGVENVHSYIANGLVVSNTVNMPAQPFFVPAWKRHHPNYVNRVKDTLDRIPKMM